MFFMLEKYHTFAHRNLKQTLKFTVMATYRIIYKEDMSVTVGKKKFNTLQELKDEVNASDFSLYDVQNRLFEIKQTTITKPDGSTLVSTTTKVTGKGQIYFS